MADIKHFISVCADGVSLSREETRQAFGILMSGDATPAQIAGLLMAMRVRGETEDEFAGAAEAMRERMIRVEAPPGAIDVVGTGGDAKGSLNVSTATALVVSGCGVPVAKHGNRALSSKSGAADALAELGVNLDLDPERIAECIKEAGIGFMFAPAHHPAVRHVGPARVELGTRTLFNLLGPMCNPAGTRRQLLGVFSPKWLGIAARVFRELGGERAWIVHGDGYDEITVTGSTRIASLENGEIKEWTLSPSDFGFETRSPQSISGGDSKVNAEALRKLLCGEASAYRDMVVMNAAGALMIAEAAGDLKEASGMAQRSIDDGAAASALERLVSVSNRDAKRRDGKGKSES